MISSTATAWRRGVLLLIAFLVAAAQPAVAQIEVEVGRDASFKKSLRLTNSVNCRRDAYDFLLTADRDFISLPADPIELSSRTSTIVNVEFSAAGLSPGLHTATITVECVNCVACRTDDKSLQVAMTVLEDATGSEDESADPIPLVVESVSGVTVPDVSGLSLAEASTRLHELGLQPVMQRSGFGPGNLPAVLSQRPQPGTVVTPGSNVSLVPGVLVPDLLGLDRAGARARLEELGLSLSIASSDVADGAAANVAGQDPAANAIVAIGSVVSLRLTAASGFSLAWWPVLLLPLIAALLFFFWRLSARTAAAPVASLDVRPRTDPGTQRLWPDISGQEEAEIRVRLSNDAGEQSVSLDPVPNGAKEQI